MLAAHEILQHRGASFVFGFPNENSYPLFTKKLGYRELPSMNVNVLNIPFHRNAFIRKDPPELVAIERGAVLQNDHQLIELKRQKYGAALLREEVDGSVAWGLKRSKVRRGIPVPYLDVGGIDLKSRGHLLPVLQRLRKAAGVIAYTQVVTIEGNSLNNLFRGLRPANTNCLIIYDLNMKTEPGIAFNFFNGVRDVY
jgi:hypothetical protein